MTIGDFSYPARLTPDEDGRLVVSFRDVPEALTDGASLEEALFEARDCLGGALLTYIDDARFPRPIPEPSRCEAGERSVNVSPRTAAKLALHQALRDQRMSVKRFAGVIGVSETVARRLLNPGYRSNFDKLVEALEAVGRRVEMRVLEVG